MGRCRFIAWRGRRDARVAT